MKIDEALIAELVDFFTAEPDVTLAFLFGSASSGQTATESDLDIAVWLNEPLKETFNSIWNSLEDISKRSVDLIDLRTAVPSIAWVALRGKRLSVRDEQLFLNLVLEKSREAQDFSEWVLDLWRLRDQAKKAG